MARVYMFLFVYKNIVTWGSTRSKCYSTYGEGILAVNVVFVLLIGYCEVCILRVQNNISRLKLLLKCYYSRILKHQVVHIYDIKHSITCEGDNMTVNPLIYTKSCLLRLFYNLRAAEQTSYNDIRVRKFSCFQSLIVKKVLFNRHRASFKMLKIIYHQRASLNID